MKTFGFTDTNDFAEFLADTVDKLRVDKNIGVGLCVVAKYHTMKDILNSIIKNTNFELESCEEFDDPILTEYDGEYVLCLDMDNLLVNILKSDCVMFDEDDIVFVHGDVNSAFVKENKDSGCTMHEFNIGEIDESDDDYKDNKSTEDAKVTYKINDKKVSKDEYDQAVKKFDEDWDDINKSINLHHNKYSDNKYSLRNKPYFTGSIDDIASLLWWDLFKC